MTARRGGLTDDCALASHSWRPLAGWWVWLEPTTGVTMVGKHDRRLRWTRTGLCSILSQHILHGERMEGMLLGRAQWPGRVSQATDAHSKLDLS